jgi:hypothetical protein
MKCHYKSGEWYGEKFQNLKIYKKISPSILALKKLGHYSTHGKLSCPYYMKNNKVFTLTNDNKTSFFIATNGSY